MDLRGKKVIALGERDGVPGPGVAECANRAGGQVVRRQAPWAWRIRRR
jgi:glycine/sarcosine/betaine reductase complex component A